MFEIPERKEIPLTLLSSLTDDFCITFKYLLQYSLSIKRFLSHLYVAVSVLLLPHQWRSGSALKTGRREIPSSIRDRACQPNRAEFSVVFSETHGNMVWIP